MLHCSDGLRTLSWTHVGRFVCFDWRLSGTRGIALALTPVLSDLCKYSDALNSSISPDVRASI